MAKKRLSQRGFANSGNARGGATRESMKMEGSLMAVRPRRASTPGIGSAMPIKGKKPSEMRAGKGKGR